MVHYKMYVLQKKYEIKQCNIEIFIYLTYLINIILSRIAEEIFPRRLFNNELTILLPTVIVGIDEIRNTHIISYLCSPKIK
jgi:hypothetical protein